MHQRITIICLGRVSDLKKAQNIELGGFDKNCQKTGKIAQFYYCLIKHDITYLSSFILTISQTIALLKYGISL